MIALTPYKHRSPSLEAMAEDTPTGCCICCDGPLPEQTGFSRRKRVICKSLECLKLYHQIYRLDRGRRERPSRNEVRS